MNKLKDTYVLHILWGYVRYIGYKLNLKYIGLSLVYIIIILMMVPVVKTTVYTSTYVQLDSYITKALTKDDKIANILEKYNLTKNEFKILTGIVLSEAESNSYEDAYAVINTIYNRTHSINWVKSIERTFGRGRGQSLYYQAIAPNQFTVYKSGSYKKHINDINSVGYDAIIDFLYSEEVMHDYLSFRSHSIKINGSESFSQNGNNYFNIIKEENRI